MLIRIRSTVALTALVSGELDYHSVLGPAVAAAIRGVPVKIVACYTPRVATAIIALPEFKSVQDLRGKTIGINSLGGGLEGQARLMLKHFGLDAEKDVKLLATGGMESRLTAMKQGFTVATLGSPPIEFVGKKLGFVVLARARGTFQLPFKRFDRQCEEDQRAAGRDQANDQSGHRDQPVYFSESRGHTASHDGVDEDRSRDGRGHLRWRREDLRRRFNPARRRASAADRRGQEECQTEPRSFYRSGGGPIDSQRGAEGGRD